jgi:ABC-2 type transport system ATP-binding protein
MADAIVIQGLKKVFKGVLGDRVAAVDDLSIAVSQGEIFGFIGPNGAGKTTTIKILLGLLFPTSGKLQALGAPAGDNETKRRISYLPESPYFYEHMSGYEVLDFYCKLFRLDKSARKKKVNELLERVGLASDGKRALRQYSKGMLQRIGIAQSLINDPDLLILDEPTSGLDPIAHKDIQDLIISLKEQGKTVFVSSHQLTDIESVCDRVAIINRGKLIKLGSMEELLHIGRTVITFTGADDSVLALVKAVSEECVMDGNLLRVYVKSEEAVHEVLAALKGKAALVSVMPQRQTLEDLFVQIVREARK